MPATLQILGTSATISFLVANYAPQYSLGYVLNGTVLALAQIVGWIIWTTIIYPGFFSPLRHIPTPPDNRLFTGQTRRVFREASGVPMRDWVENVPNDGLIRYSVWLQERILVTSPQALSEVLVTKAYDFVKPKYLRASVGRILGIGILFTEGDEHRRQRKNLMPAFAFRHVKELYPLFWSKAREMVEGVSKASKSTASPSLMSDTSGPTPDAVAVEDASHAPGVVEVGSWSTRAALDIIGLCGMGQDFNSLGNPKNELNETYRGIFNPSKRSGVLLLAGLFLPQWFLKRLPIKRNGEIDNAMNYIKQVCRDLITKKREKIAGRQKTGIDILSVAFESGGFTDEELVNQMMTFLLAGHETTAAALMWAIYILAKHPNIQQRLRDEVRSRLPSLDEEVTAADIDGCSYLHAVCSEVLRIWPPVPLTLRVAEVDTSLNGQFVPKGTYVVLAPWATNVSTHLWGADAMDFKPERWLDANGKADNSGGANSNFPFLTFLHGPRSCIGQRFAQAEFACLLAAWVGRFATQLEEGSALVKGDLEIQGGISAKPKAGVWVSVKEIESW